MVLRTAVRGMRLRTQRVRPSLPYIISGCIAMAAAIHSMPPGKYVMGGDTILPALNPGIALTHLASTWSSSSGLGGDGSFGRALLFPFVVIDWISSKAGASPIVINNGWVVAIVVIQAITTTWLFRTLLPRLPRLAAASAGALAVINPYMLITFHTPYPSTALSIAVMPGAVAALVRVARNFAPKSVATLILILLVMATGDNNYGVTAAECLVLLPATLVASVLVRPLRTRLRFVLAVALAFVAANIMWLLPGAAYVLGAFGTLVNRSATYSATTVAVTSQYSGLGNSLRLIGDYLFFNSVGGRPYVAGGTLYASNVAVIALSSTLPVLSLIGALALRESRPIRVIAAATAVALFWAKGAAPPLGRIFVWLIVHFAALNAFRDSFSMLGWIAMYGYAILASAALCWIASHARAWAGRAAAGLLFAGAVCGAFPILMGQLFASQAVTPVPTRYFAMASWFNSQRTAGSILEMPVSPYAYDVYRWGYVGVGLNPNLIRRPILSRMSDLTSPPTEAIDNAFQYAAVNVGIGNVANVLGLYGVRYILNDESINPRYFNPGFTSTLLHGAVPGAVVAKHFPGITIYQIARALVNPLFYSPRSVFVSRVPLTVTEEGELCRIRGTCKGAAFVTGRASGGHSGTVVSFSTSPPVLAASAAVYQHSWSDELRRYAGSVYAGAPRGEPLGRVGSVGKSANPICSSPLALGGRAYRFELGRSTSYTLLRVEYRDASTNPILAVRASRGQGIFVASLRRGERPSVFARILRFPSGAKSVTVEVTVSPSSEPGCFVVTSVSLEALGSPSVAIPLSGNGADFFATPLGVAREPNLAAQFASEVPVHLRGGAVARVSDEGTMGAAPDTALSWTMVESLRYPIPAGGAVALSVPRDGAQTFDVRGDSGDVHLFAGGLIPGARYDVSVRYRDIVGAPATFVVLDQDGAVLSTGTLPYSRRWHRWEATVELPPGSSTLRLYIYLSAGPGRAARVGLSRAVVALANPGAFVAISHVTEQPTPRVVRFESAGAAAYRVRVAGAPKRFLLVMNATYSPEWKVVGVGASQVQHVVVDGGLNGWWVEPHASSMSFVVEYGIQNWVLWGFVGSAVAALLAMLAAAGVGWRSIRDAWPRYH